MIEFVMELPLDHDGKLLHEEDGGKLYECIVRADVEPFESAHITGDPDDSTPAQGGVVEDIQAWRAHDNVEIDLNVGNWYERVKMDVEEKAE